jgi:hypothetical protein
MLQGSQSPVGSPTGQSLEPSAELRSPDSSPDIPRREGQDSLGIGMDPLPPADAFSAFGRHSDGAEAPMLGMTEVEQLLLVLRSDHLDWDGVMPNASSDAIILGIIDMSCDAGVGAGQSMDERRCKVASHAQMVLAFEVEAPWVA